MIEVQEDHRPTALVVDDDGILCMDVAEILEEAGCCTLEAATGDEAMAVLEQHHLDVTLLFSDVEMPGSRNGFALAREVAVKSPYIAIVIASGRMPPGYGDLPEGARFIGKPFNAEAVHGHLQEVLPSDQRPKAVRG